VTEHSDREQRSRAFLRDLEPEYDDVLLHLLECADCRELARTLLGSGERLVEAALQRAVPSLAELHRHGGATWKRLSRLLAASPALRAELLRSDEFRDLELADLLLERAEAAQPQDLDLSEELAHLAFAIAEPMVQAHWMAWANDVKARACELVGKVRRLERDGGPTLANHPSGAKNGPDFPKGDAVWK